MIKKHALVSLTIAVLVCWGHCAHAVINVGLQPYDLFQSRYKQVVILTIDTVKPQAGLVHCKVTESLKGKIGVGQKIQLSFVGDMRQMVGQYDEQGDILSIHGVPKALRDQLLKHMKS